MIPRSIVIGCCALLLLAGITAPLEAQQIVQRTADCVFAIPVMTAVGTGSAIVNANTNITTGRGLYDNRGSGCVDWTLAYSTFGFSAATIQIVDAPNNSSSAGTPVAFQGTVLNSVTQPVTVSISGGFGQGTINVTGYYPYMGVALVSKTGTGSLQGTLMGWKRSGNAMPAAPVTGTLTGTLTNNNAAPGANNVGVLPCLATATPTALTEGNQVLCSVTLNNRQRTTLPIITTAPFMSAALGAAVNAFATSNVVVDFLSCQNASTTANAFVQTFNTTAASVTLGSTTPIEQYMAPFGGGFIIPNMHTLYSNGLVLASTTTASGATPQAVVCTAKVYAP